MYNLFTANLDISEQYVEEMLPPACEIGCEVNDTLFTQRTANMFDDCPKESLVWENTEEGCAGEFPTVNPHNMTAAQYGFSLS